MKGFIKTHWKDILQIIGALGVLAAFYSYIKWGIDNNADNLFFEGLRNFYGK